MDTIKIPDDVKTVISTSSKGDQAKWIIGDKWVKENTHGYENIAEYITSLLLESSTIPSTSYVTYTPCFIEKPDGTVKEGCYSRDFRGKLQEVTLERIFEANFETTDNILNNDRFSTKIKFQLIIEKIHQYTGLEVSHEISQMLALDAFILNEDRHTNNILFLYNPKSGKWKLAPIFDNGLGLLSDTKDYPLKTPISILKRKVKAKPFSTSFSKQLELYKGLPFINQKEFLNKLEVSPFKLGRAKTIIQSQLKEPSIKRILFNE